MLCPDLHACHIFVFCETATEQVQQTSADPLAAQDHGFFLQKPEGKNAQEQMMANPEMMQDMMKKNLGGLVPQVCLPALYARPVMLGQVKPRSPCTAMSL